MDPGMWIRYFPPFAVPAQFERFVLIELRREGVVCPSRAAAKNKRPKHRWV
jgi:hypothetical protein